MTFVHRLGAQPGEADVEAVGLRVGFDVLDALGIRRAGSNFDAQLVRCLAVFLKEQPVRACGAVKRNGEDLPALDVGQRELLAGQRVETGLRRELHFLFVYPHTRILRRDEGFTVIVLGGQAHAVQVVARRHARQVLEGERALDLGDDLLDLELHEVGYVEVRRRFAVRIAGGEQIRDLTVGFLVGELLRRKGILRCDGLKRVAVRGHMAERRDVERRSWHQ